MAGADRSTPVDTGFIVSSYANYPNLTKLFDHLDVPVEALMSFSASFDHGQFEYALQSLNSLFAQRRNIVSHVSYRFLRDLTVFNRHALAASQEDGLTIAGLMKKLSLSDFSGSCASVFRCDLVDAKVRGHGFPCGQLAEVL